MRIYRMLGYKLCKQREDGSVHVVRIVGFKKPFKITITTKDPSEITIFDYDDNQRKKVKVETLKGYAPIKPDGIFTACIANVVGDNKDINKDVIVTATKFLNIEYKVNMMPYAVCRQSITDIFYNLLTDDESKTLVGLSVNQDTCPANFDFGIMFAANSIVYDDFINFYRTDTLKDILALIDTHKYDEVLKSLFEAHVKYINRPELLFKNEHGGWCKDLKTLLAQNNFQADINQMLGITDVDFKLDEFFDTKSAERNGETYEYKVANNDLRLWLSSIFKVNMEEAAVIEFGQDINLGDFNDNRYVLLRDNTDKLYLVVYTTNGERYKDDLISEAQELDFSTKFKIEFYNKYNKDNK